MSTLRWLRVLGDTAFAIGAVLLVLFVAGLGTGRSYRSRGASRGLPAGDRVTSG